MHSAFEPPVTVLGTFSTGILRDMDRDTQRCSSSTVYNSEKWRPSKCPDKLTHHCISVEVVKQSIGWFLFSLCKRGCVGRTLGGLAMCYVQVMGFWVGLVCLRLFVFSNLSSVTHVCLTSQVLQKTTKMSWPRFYEVSVLSEAKGVC